MTNACGHISLKQYLARTHTYWENKETLDLWRWENVERNEKILSFNKKIANTSVMYEDSCAFLTSCSSKSATECCLHMFMYKCRKLKSKCIFLWR